MKFFVHYDSSGAIRSVVAVDTPGARSPMLSPRPGLFVAELEGGIPELKLRPTLEELQSMRKVVRNLRVETTPHCKLVRKA